MNEEYITGHIYVIFAGFQKEIVELEYSVQGRAARIILDNGDLIEIIDQEPVITLTTDDILDSFENENSKNHSDYWLNDSYQGRKVRVKLNPATTKQIREKHKKNAMDQLFKSIETKIIKSSEAAEIYERINKMYEEDEVLD